MDVRTRPRPRSRGSRRSPSPAHCRPARGRDLRGPCGLAAIRWRLTLRRPQSLTRPKLLPSTQVLAVVGTEGACVELASYGTGGCSGDAGQGRWQLPFMVEIHFCGPDDRPLCGRDGDRWLWTALTETVTCPGCGVVLERERRREREPDLTRTGRAGKHE